MKIVKNPIGREELLQIAKEGFGDLVKAVVDIEQGMMAVGGELHADEEAELVEKHGSKRENIWGINLYPQKPDEEWIEFDSMINLKPAHGNRSRGVDDAKIQKKIKEVVAKLVPG
ncbi:hypothetical protein C4571_01625 [Candidatus Parcubacteria bacterium]|nr:MAG: hypothetical protein C4571_01625 [Candidatus Parcubacteria bacterium]